jgi:hypothetical protein
MTVRLIVTVGAAQGVLADAAFLALSLSSTQYFHTAVRKGLFVWNEAFEFIVDPPAQLILTAHHAPAPLPGPAPGQLCGQGMLALAPSLLAAATTPGGIAESVPLLLDGRAAGIVRLTLAVLPRGGPGEEEPPSPRATGPAGAHHPSAPHIDPSMSEDEQIRLLTAHLEALEAAEGELLATHANQRAARLAELDHLQGQVAAAWQLHQQGPRPPGSRRTFAPMDDAPSPGHSRSQSVASSVTTADGFDDRPVSEPSAAPSRSRSVPARPRALRPTAAPQIPAPPVAPRRRARTPAPGRATATVLQLAWRRNESGTPRRVRPPGTREMTYTGPKHAECDWGASRGHGSGA